MILAGSWPADNGWRIRSVNSPENSVYAICAGGALHADVIHTQRFRIPSASAWIMRNVLTLPRLKAGDSQATYVPVDCVRA
jgi:hypothetical protein